MRTKRETNSSFCSYFLGILFFTLIVTLFSIKPQRVNEEFIYKYSLFENHTANNSLKDKIVGIISNNSENKYVKQFVDYLMNNEKIKEAKIFPNFDNLSNYLNSKEYLSKNKMNFTFNFIFHNESEDEFEIKFQIDNLALTSLNESSHKLNVLEKNEAKKNSFNKIKLFSLAQQIITNFLKNSNDIQKIDIVTSQFNNEISQNINNYFNTLLFL